MITQPTLPGSALDRALLLARPIIEQVPRLLGLVDRRPHSPTYGCCSRIHWQDHAIPTPDARMQSLALVLALAWKLDLPDNPYHRSPELLAWIEGILDYTNLIQRPGGQFEVTCRGMDAYHTTGLVAFCASEATLQLGRHLAPGVRNTMRDTLARAIRRMEKSNGRAVPEALALAAAACMNHAELDPGTGGEAAMGHALDDLQARQTEEGWFPHGGGLDVGAESLTLGWLALIARRTSDLRAREMAGRSAALLEHCLHPDGTVGGVYSSQGSEFLAPLGPILLAAESAPAARICAFLFGHDGVGHPGPVPRALDDGHLATLAPAYALAVQAVLELDATRLQWRATQQLPAHYFPEAGLWFVETRALKLVANLRKGGVFRLNIGDEAYVDSGYFGHVPDGQIVTTHHPQGSVDRSAVDRTARLSARLAIHTPIRTTPWKDVVRRFCRLTVPGVLRRAIRARVAPRRTGPGQTVGWVHRSIEVQEEAVEVTDFIEVSEPVLRLALQLGKESIHSTGTDGFFQPLDLRGDDGLMAVELEAGRVVVKRRYSAAGMEVLPA